jgi:hypothetical protein
MIADVFTAEFRALQATLFAHLAMDGDRGETGGDVDSGGARLRDALDACGENEGLVALFEKAIDAHLEVLARHKAGMESYLHLFLLTNEMGTLPVPSPPSRPALRYVRLTGRAGFLLRRTTRRTP